MPKRDEQLLKIKCSINEIANGYFLADQKLALLTPLLADHKLISTWKNTAGIFACRALKHCLWSSIIADMKAWLFDQNEKTASVHNVIRAFKDPNFALRLKCKFTKPPNTIRLSNDASSATQWRREFSEMEQVKFDHLMTETIRRFDELEATELAKRIKIFRDKIISHKEIQTLDGERGLYDPKALGLKWEDATSIVQASEDLIFNINYLVNKSSYIDKDQILAGHLKAAKIFWSRL